MKIIDAKQCTAIALGRLGENDYTVVRFDVSAWLNELPGAVIGLYNQRPGDGAAYPVAGITVEGGIVTWTVTSAELTQTGEGKCELVAIAGEVVAKSAIFRTMVFDALDGSGEAPEPWEEWQQQLIILKNDAEQAADRAEEAAEHYPRIVEGVWEVWDAQAGVYVSTGVQALGVNGISPTITVAPITGGQRITITDANGTHTVDVLDGENGDPGRGIVSVQKTGTAGLVDTYTITYTDSTTSTFTVTNGQNGTNGISPSITVTDITGGHRVTITDADGQHSFDVMDGESSVKIQGNSFVEGKAIYISNGKIADPSDSPTFCYCKIPCVSGDTIYITGQGGNNARLWIVADAEGNVLRNADVYAVGNNFALQVSDTGAALVVVNASLSATHSVERETSVSNAISELYSGDGCSVTDVQVNGTSVVQDGVANVPIASVDVFGATKIARGKGLYKASDNGIGLYPATDAQVKQGNDNAFALTSNKTHEIAFYGLAKAAGDSTQSASSNAVGTYTDAAKSAIQTMLNGPVTVSGTTPTITALPGIRYVCGEVTTLDITLPASGIVDVVFQSGSTATVLTITPPTGVTLKWANGFDPTALEANTTYEINIMDGLGVGVGWT